RSNEEWLRRILEKRGDMIRYIKPEFITEKLLKIAIKHDVDNIRYIPLRRLSGRLRYKTIKYAVAKNHEVLRYIDYATMLEPSQIYKIWRIGYKSNVWILKYIPDEYVTQKILFEALKKDSGIISIIKTPLYEHIVYAVTKNGENIAHVGYRYPVGSSTFKDI